MDDRVSIMKSASTAAVLLALASTSTASPSAPAPNTWHELAALPMTWFQDMSFVSARVGFAAGGNGQVLRTTDGALTWTPVLDTPYSHYYWYGVHALTPNDIVATGFINIDNAFTAMIRWSHDGGDTWTDDLVLSHNDVHPNHVHFWNSQLGFVATSSGDPDVFRTASGGLALADWDAQTVAPTWFGPQFSALPNGHVRMAGYQYCESLDYAATWSCHASVDPVSDYATYFVDDQHGWVGGGGGIGVPTGDPPKFEGWVHVTTDGGETWSDRTLDIPWPIRSVVFVNKRDGWAIGGYAVEPIYPDSGGAYISHDGGLTWTMEADVGVALQTCATADYHLFCAGIDSSATTHVFERDFDHIRVGGFDGDETP